MNKLQHRVGVSGVNLVNRHLKIKSSEKTLLQLAVTEIDSLYGIDGVSFDKKSKVLHLAYDASLVDIKTIEGILEEHQVIMSRDWWSRLKLGHYRFVDQNVKDNRSYHPHCCNKVPGKFKKHT